VRSAEWGWIEVMHSLLQDGKVDVNDSDLFGETALLKAAKQGRCSCPLPCVSSVSL